MKVLNLSKKKINAQGCNYQKQIYKWKAFPFIEMKWLNKISLKRKSLLKWL